jgi:hypothetical protein
MFLAVDLVNDSLIVPSLDGGYEALCCWSELYAVAAGGTLTCIKATLL